MIELTWSWEAFTLAMTAKLGQRHAQQPRVAAKVGMHMHPCFESMLREFLRLWAIGGHSCALRQIQNNLEEITQSWLPMAER